MTIRELLDHGPFWEGQAREFECMMLDYVKPSTDPSILQFYARLYLQGLRGMIRHRLEIKE